jgi:ribonuclease R
MVGGKIVEILGEGGDFYTEELSIIRSYGLNETFPAPVEKQAEEVAKEQVTPFGRVDLRDTLTITIDGEDTRDIDDAVSLTRDGENFILGVHIADVSHYVKYGSKIDREAYDRGTSVYFPDRVLPMLPKALSNGACSLNEGEDRYAMSAIMTFDKNGNIFTHTGEHYKQQPPHDLYGSYGHTGRR